MDVDQTTLQQAMLSQTILNVQTTGILITAQLTLFFGYFGALYLFLRHLGVFVRFLTFFFYALANGFLITGHIAIQEVSKRTLQWREYAIENNQLPEYFTAGSVGTYNELTAVIQVLLNVLNYGSVVFLFYMTFLHRWRG